VTAGEGHPGGMTVESAKSQDGVAEASPAAQAALAARKKSRRLEFREHMRLAQLLDRYVDPETTFWTSLENRPRSWLSGLMARRRGVRSGMPDVLILFGGRLIFIELKSRSGVLSKVQREVRLRLLKAGAEWWMVRSARAGLAALCRSGVIFLRPLREPALGAWEGPFTGAERRLPSHPQVAAAQSAYNRVWREKRRALGLPTQSVARRVVSTEERRAKHRDYLRRWRAKEKEKAPAAAAARIAAE
jgi:hypothetical protein